MQGNLGHFNTAPGAPCNLLSIALKHIEGAATDGTQSTNAYFDRFQTLYPIFTVIGPAWLARIKEPHLTKRLSISQSAATPLANQLPAPSATGIY
jgi:hypothetical protein